MRRKRLLYSICLVGSACCGYVAGIAYERTSLWAADQRLAELLQIEPRSLTDVLTEPAEQTASVGLRFEEAEAHGIPFAYENGSDGEFHLAETLGGGVGAIDLDADGRPDLIFVDGGHPMSWPADQASRIRAYRQTGSVKFQNAASSGLSWHGYGHGCAVADFDNDGFDDVLITGYEKSTLFKNLGDGTFQETDLMDDSTLGRWCATACWTDVDDDGDLDVYIACYADVPRNQPLPVCDVGGIRIHCNPSFYSPASDILLENTGDGKFRDRSSDSGVAALQEYGLGVISLDLDQDGDREIFVANDGQRNLLFTPDGEWTLKDSALISGVAFSGQGETMGSMGIGYGDMDGNGLPDLLVTNFSNESNALYLNMGQLAFVDSAQGTAIDQTSRPMVGWSSIVFDANYDTQPDIFAANGHVTEMPGEPFLQMPSLLMGSPNGFRAVENAGRWFQTPQQARGACRVDVDGDTLDDLVVSEIGMPAAVLLNRTAAAGNRFTVRTIGTRSPRSADAVGVTVTIGDTRRFHVLTRCAGYLSSNSGTLSIGLGSAASADRVSVRWAGNRIQEFSDVAAGRRIVLIEGRTDPIVMP
ncbi:MAG: CRTAC1 family protein [Planctomycetaceae bacterium]